MSDSSLGRLAGVLMAPGKTFASIARRPTWAVAMIVLVAVGVVVTWLMTSRIDFAEVTRESIEAGSRNLTEEQIERAIDIQERMGPKLALVGPLIFGPLVYFGSALVFWLVFKLVGGEFGYRTSLAVAVHGLVPLGVAGLLHLPVILGRQTIGYADVRGGSNLLASNLGYFAPEDTSVALAALLNSVDLFSIWAIVLLSIGYAAVAGVSKKTAAITVTVLWLCGILLKVGWAALAA